MSLFPAIRPYTFLSSYHVGFHGSGTKITCELPETSSLGFEEILPNRYLQPLPALPTPAHAPSPCPPLSFTSEEKLDKFFSSTQPFNDWRETTAVNCRINKEIPKAISAAWQISKHMALGQQGASFPPRLNHQLTVGNNLFDANEKPNIYKSVKQEA